MSSKIYIVSEYVDAEQNSTGYYWSKIILALSCINKKIEVFSSKKSCKLAEQSIKNSRVSFVPFKNKRKDNLNIFKRAFSDIFFSLRIAFAVYKKSNRGDVVICGTNPAFLFFFLSFIKLLKKYKLVVLAHDVFPENLLPAYMHNKKYFFLLQPIIFLFNIAYSNLTALIVIGRDMKEVFLKKIYSNKVLVEYIPNFVDFVDIQMPYLKDEILKEDIRNQKITFNFFGNLGPLQGIDNLLNAIYLTKNDNIKFNFIGNGLAEDSIKKFIDNNPTIDIKLFNNLPFSKKNEMLYDGDVAIISLTEGMKGLAVPSKTYFSIAANKPILAIADKGSELEYLINENKGIGWFCDAGNPQKLAEQINHIYEIAPFSNNDEPLKVAKRYYEYSVIKDKYINLVNRI